jgi:hypothetical protein
MNLSAQVTTAWSVIEKWLDRDRIRFLCLGILGVTILFMVVSFIKSDENHQTWLGKSLGADFAGFYYAGKILNGPTPKNLYDPITQDESYYEILPTLQDKENLPYVHPPIVAWAFRPLARLPYPTAYAIWLVISAGLYGAGLALTWRLVPSIPKDHRTTAFLLAITFEPCLMECWLGGQLSAFAFFCVALAFYWEQAGRPILSGLALGLCLYKPTLLVLLLPMLVVARRGWNLFGVGLTALGLSLVSLLTVGSQVCFSYFDALRGFTGTATGRGMVIKDWKYIDLNFFFRNLFGEPTLLGKVLVLVLALAPLTFLIISWWRLDRSGEAYRRLVWASTVTWTMVLNVYMGPYDMILVVLALLWTADIFYRPGNRLEPSFPAFKLLVFLVIVLSWITQRPLAERTGFQIITPVLFAMAAFQLRLAWKVRSAIPESVPSTSDSPIA